MVNLLIEGGADVNHYDFTFPSALQLAVQRENFEISKLLVDRGATLDLNDRASCSSAIKLAIERRNSIIFSLFLNKLRQENYINIIHDQDQMSLLHFAVQHGNLGFVRMVLDAAANVDTRDNWGRTPLRDAVATNNIRVMELLISRGANVHTVDSIEFENLLHEAAAANALGFDGRILSFILENGCFNVNQLDSAGRSPIFYTTLAENKYSSLMLLEAGANLNSLNLQYGAAAHQEDTAVSFYIRFLLYDDNYGDDKFDHRFFKFIVDRTDFGVINSDGRNLITAILSNERVFVQLRPLHKILIQHLAKREFTNEQNGPIASILEWIQATQELKDYMTSCKQELRSASTLNFNDSWVTCRHIISQPSLQLIKFAGNSDVSGGLNVLETLTTFPIYGEIIVRRMENAIENRKYFDEASKILSHFLPIFGPDHSIIRDLLFTLTKKDWKIFCSFKKIRQ